MMKCLRQMLYCLQVWNASKNKIRSDQSLSCVWLFATPWIAARQASLSPTPGVHWDSRPLHWWCHPAISSSDVLFSFCPQSFPATGTFPMSQLFPLDDQNTGVSTSASVLPTSIQGWFPLRLTGLISLLSTGLSGVCSSTTVQRHRFFGAPPSLWSRSLNRTWPLGRHCLDYTDFCRQSIVSAFQHAV